MNSKVAQISNILSARQPSPPARHSRNEISRQEVGRNNIRSSASIGQCRRKSRVVRRNVVSLSVRSYFSTSRRDFWPQPQGRSNELEFVGRRFCRFLVAAATGPTPAPAFADIQPQIKCRSRLPVLLSHLHCFRVSRGRERRWVTPPSIGWNHGLRRCARFSATRAGSTTRSFTCNNGKAASPVVGTRLAYVSNRAPKLPAPQERPTRTLASITVAPLGTRRPTNQRPPSSMPSGSHTVKGRAHQRRKNHSFPSVFVSYRPFQRYSLLTSEIRRFFKRLRTTSTLPTMFIGFERNSTVFRWSPSIQYSFRISWAKWSSTRKTMILISPQSLENRIDYVVNQHKIFQIEEIILCFGIGTMSVRIPWTSSTSSPRWKREPIDRASARSKTTAPASRQLNRIPQVWNAVLEII